MLVALLCLPFASMAQSLEISPAGNVPQCPGNIVSYNTYMSGGPAPDYSGCSFRWSITKGKFFTTNSSADLTTTNNSVAVIWDDVTEKGTLSVTLTECETTSLRVSRTTGGVIIRSINGVDPSQIKVNNVAKTNHYLEWCSTTPITLAIDRLKIPNTPSTSNPSYGFTLYTDMYEWILPAGWRTSDNRTGTFTTSEYSISVIPEAGAAGQVKVRGYNQECSLSSSPRTNFYSNYSTLTITREPQPGTITVNGSATAPTLFCGDRSPLTLSVPALAGADYYTWSLPAGWAITSTPSNSNTVTVEPSGTGAGQVSVSATFTCSSPAKTVNATAITIGYNKSLKAPVFSNAPYDIGSSTAYSVEPVPGATGYTWETSDNILINGQLSPQHNLPASVMLSQRPGYSGAGWVRATATNPQCGSSSVTKDVWVGLPEIIDFSYFGSSDYPTCPFEQFTFAPIYNGYKGQPLRYRWTVSNVSSHGDLTGSSLIVTAAGYGGGTRMSIGLEVETTLGWTQQRVMLYEIRDCDSGAEPWFAPNPVTEDEFTIESDSDGSYSYTLYDQQGNIKLSGKSKAKKAKVNTKGLSNGLYLLRIEQSGIVTTKRVIIQK